MRVVLCNRLCITEVLIKNIKGHDILSKRYRRDIEANHNCNKTYDHFRERIISYCAREKISRDTCSSYLLIKESQLFIEDARIFYISYAKRRRDVADE